MSALKHLTQNVLKVRSGEYERTGWMFVLLSALVSSFITGRIIRDTLFLDIPNIKSQLPIMYVAVSVVVAVATTVVTRLNARMSRVRFMVAAMLFMIGTLIGSRLVMGQHRPWFPYAFYIWVDVFGSIMIVQFWTFANEVFNAREAKRLFAVIGGGGVVANIVIGFLVGQNAQRIGLENVLWIFVAMLAVSIVALLLARRAQPADAAAPAMAGARAGAGRSIFGSRYLKLIAAATVCTFIATTLGDYEFKLIVSESITDRNARAAYFGTFYGVTGFLSAFVQFFLTNRILERAGILPALVLLPSSLFAGAVAVFATPVLAAASYLKGAENTLRYTINDATTQLLYLPISKDSRARAKAFIDGILRPLAVGVAGLALFLLSARLTHRWVSAALAGVTATWVVLIVLLRNEYLKTLLTTLKQRRLDFDGMSRAMPDENTLAAFRETLEKGSAEEMLTVLDILASSGLQSAQVETLVLPLLKHPDDDVKIAALNFFGARGRPELAKKLEASFDHQSEPVRAAAVAAFCALARDDAAMVLERFLDDESLLVQGATVAGLIKNGGLEGVLTAADQLKAMIEDPRPAVRERASWVLGEISVASFYRPLVSLLHDPDRGVRDAAIAAAGKLRSLRLLDPLLELIRDESAAPLVVDALASYGADIEPQALAAFLSPAQTARTRAHLCRVLQRVGGADCVRVFMSDLPQVGDRLRTQCMQAALRIVARKPEAKPDPGMIERALTRESEGLFQLHVMIREIGECSDLLHSELADRVEDSLARLFCALSYSYSSTTLEIVAANLSSADVNVRANAAEVLDNTLSAEHKPLVLPLVDEGALKALLESSLAAQATVHHERNDWLRELLLDREPWMVVAALHTLGSYRVPGVEKQMTACLTHEEPWVRETALWALSKVVAPELLPSKAQKLIGDEVERVRHYGEHVMAEITMISNVEKVLFLKKIDLFRRIRGEDLARIANIAEEMSFNSNELVFNDGDLGDALYLIVAGKVKIHKGDTQLAVLGERQCFGEISILDSEPRSASVTAVESLLTLKIRRDDFGEIMAQKPEIAQGVIKVLCARLRNANKR